LDQWDLEVGESRGGRGWDEGDEGLKIGGKGREERE